MQKKKSSGDPKFRQEQGTQSQIDGVLKWMRVFHQQGDGKLKEGFMPISDERSRELPHFSLGRADSMKATVRYGKNGGYEWVTVREEGLKYVREEGLRGEVYYRAAGEKELVSRGTYRIRKGFAVRLDEKKKR